MASRPPVPAGPIPAVCTPPDPKAPDLEAKAAEAAHREGGGTKEEESVQIMMFPECWESMTRGQKKNWKRNRRKGNKLNQFELRPNVNVISVLTATKLSVYIGGGITHVLSAGESGAHFKTCGAIDRCVVLESKNRDVAPKSFAFIDFAEAGCVERAFY